MLTIFTFLLFCGFALCQDPKENKFFCNAEDGKNSDCELIQVTSDNFDWTKNSGKTATGSQWKRRVGANWYPETGPEKAYKGDYYLYAEGDGQGENDIARLQLMNNNLRIGQNCVRFSFSMNGVEMGELSLIIKQDGNEIAAWSQSGDKLTPNWYRAAVDIDVTPQTEIFFQAKLTQGSYRTDMAIDNVELTPQSCESPPNGFLWVCQFETRDEASTMCGLLQQRNDNFDWTLFSGKTPSAYTGPAGAANGSWYLYIEASKPQKHGDIASVLLPKWQQSGTVCFSFLFNMYGYHTGTLKVFAVDDAQGNNEKELWKKNGDQGIFWQRAQITVILANANQRLLIRATRGRGYSSDIAIDTLKLKQGACPQR